MKRFRKVVSLIMMAALVILCCACEKKQEKEDVKEEVDYYKVYDQIDLDYTTGYTVVIDNTIYGYYIRDVYGKNGNPSYGLFQYDFDTGDKEELELDSEVQYIKSMYVNEADNFVICAKLYGPELSDGEADFSDAGEIKFITYEYDTDFELISKEDSLSEVSEESLSDVEVPYIYLCGDTLVKLVEFEQTENEVRLEDKAGNVIKSIPVTDMDIQGFVKLDNDTFAVLGMTGNNYKLYKLDFEKDNPEENLQKEIMDFSGKTGLSIYYRTEATLFVDMGGYLKILDIETGKLTNVLKYLDSGIDSNKVQEVYQLDEDSYAVVIYDYEHERSELRLLTKREVVQEKKEIHIATMLPGQVLEQKVMEFNQLNDKYKLVIDDYGRGGDYAMTNEEFKAAKTQFNLDILTGNGADIIDLGYYIDIKGYAGKGIFEDLLPYIEKDSEISEEDFMENIINAFKTDGKLYLLSPTVSIGAIAGKNSRLGTGISWTLREFEEYVQNLPEEVEVFPTITSDRLLKMLLMCNLDEFVDRESGKCSFNSDEFISLLETCNRYKTYKEFYEEHERLDDWGDIPSPITEIKMNMADLSTEFSVSPEGYVSVREIYGGDVMIKGYPSSEGSGLVIGINEDLTFAINSKSKYKDIAWEFLRQFYTYEGQTELGGTPIRYDAYEKKMDDIRNAEMSVARDGTEYYTSCDYGDIIMYYPKPTEEDIQYVKELISMADTVEENYGLEIFDIIEEEADTYFTGNKSAKEVADIIQSRVSIYVNEKG